VTAASQFIGDMLIEGLDRFMGVFGEDILTMQSGFEKLGLFFRAAFDWDFAINGLTKALNRVDDEVEKARQRSPDADARAADRKKKRDQNAAERGAAAAARDKGFEDTIKALREDDERAKKRARGEMPKPAEEPAKPGQPIKPKLPAAPPGAFMPPPKSEGEKDKGISSAGNWTGIGLAIGPELAKLEDPAQRTADATERTADAVAGLAGVNPAEAPAVMAPALNGAAAADGEFQAALDAVALAAADPNVTAEQMLAMSAAGQFNQPPQLAAPPAVAMEAVAPRAPDVQASANQGMQTAINASQTGVDFRQVGSEIVAAINAGTEVSKSMLGVLNRIAEKSAPEFAFQ
jgi:hypothetical protein